MDPFVVNSIAADGARYALAQGIHDWMSSRSAPPTPMFSGGSRFKRPRIYGSYGGSARMSSGSRTRSIAGGRFLSGSVSRRSYRNGGSRKGRSFVGAKGAFRRRRRFMRKGWKKRTFKRRTYRKRKLFFHTHGSVKVNETGGVGADTNCLFIGHGVAVEEATLAMCRALVALLAKKMNWSIASWEDIIPCQFGQFSIVYHYYTSATDTSYDQGSFDVQVATTHDRTYQALAVALRDNFDSEMATGDEVHLVDIGVQSQSLTGFQEVKIHAENIYLYWAIGSRLKIQNTTLSADGTGDNNDEELFVVDRNPIQGKLYKCKQWANYFEPKNRNIHNTEANYTGYIANVSSGHIFAVNQFTAVRDTKKPPPGWFFKARESSVMLQPGQIVEDKWLFKTKIKLNNFFKIFWKNIPLTNTQQQVDFGYAHMYGLEKMLDNRSETTSVNVDYEIVQRYACAALEGKARSATLLNIAA